MSAGYDAQAAADALRIMHEAGDVFEVRIPKTGRTKTVSGYFNDPDEAAAAIGKWDGKAPGVYVTVNPVDPALLARCANRLQPYAESTTADTNVTMRRWLYVDVDPERPANISASDAEHDAALELAREIVAERVGAGWPDPVVGDSGNGGHVFWRVDLPNDPAAEALVKRCLEALAERFNGAGVKVDTTVSNAARIAKTPGTMACKGDNIAERPHRRSRLLSAPESLGLVTVAQLEALAAEPSDDEAPRQRQTPPAAAAGVFDVVDFMRRHGLEVRHEKPWNGGTMYVLRQCPMNPEHDGTEAHITQLASGALSAGCKHDSCQWWDWRKLREHLEPGCYSTLPDTPATLPHPPAAASDQAPEVWQEAVPQPRLAATPDILSAFAEEVRAAGVVGEDRLVCVTYLALTSRVLDRPVSIVVKGPSSAGKSFTTEQVLRYFPESAYKSLSGMSEHALAYLDEPLSHRFLVVYEAAGLAGDLASYLVRSLLSEGRVEYVTVVKSKAGMVPKTLVIEGPTGVLTTTTAISLHPENETRLLSIPARDTADQTKAVFYALASEVQTIARPVEEWHALQTWIEQGETRVTVPFASELADLMPPVAVRLRRDFSMVLNLTRAHALLHRASRERDDDGRVIAGVCDYAAVRALIADLVSDEVGATVSAATRETVAAVVTLYRESDEKPVSVRALAGALHLDKSPAARRAREAIARGYLRNLEDKQGKPARYVPGDPLPDEQVVLPLPESLAASGTVAVVQDRGTTSAPAATHDQAPTQAECGSVAACSEGVEKKPGATGVAPSDPRIEVARHAGYLVADNGAASVALLVKRLDLYEAEAESVLDYLEALGVVGPNGGRARAVLVETRGDVDRLLGSVTR